jgi:hypothetical protein
MAQSLESIYTDIGRLIVEKLPKDWATAQVIAEERDEGVFDWRGEYNFANEETSHQFVVGSQLMRLIMLVRLRIATSDKPAWRKATFTLKPNGQFDMMFDY